MKSGPIKIIHLLHTFRVGGMENGVANLVNHLDARRFQCSIYSLSEREPDSLKDRVNDRSQIVVLHKEPGHDLAVIFRLANLFRRERALIVHTHGWGTLLEGLLAAKLARVAVVIHGEHGTTETRRRNILIQRFLWKFADQILSVSENHRRSLAGTLGVPLSMIKTIRNGVDTERYKPNANPQALRQHFGIPVDHVVVGSVGRLVEVKQYHVLMEALAPIIKSRERISGVLIGDGPLRERLEGLAQALGIGDRFHFLGHRDDVNRVLNLLDIFVLTSRSEGMSNTILEAMASGLPVVATEVGGANELVVAGKTGLLVPPHSPCGVEAALRELLLDPQKRRLMGEHSRKRTTSSFGLAKMIGAYEELYLRLVKEKTHTAPGEIDVVAHSL